MQTATSAMLVRWRWISGEFDWLNRQFW